MAADREVSPAPARPPHRWRRWLFALAGLAVFGLVVMAAGALGWEYTNSSQFCGTTCHTMPPEYASYQVSSHARVSCVDCHLGEQSILRAVPSKAMEIRHLTDALTQSFETPIEVRNLRPARDTCEQCHLPETFSADAVKEIRHYASDQQNTETSTWLVMKIGGGTQRQGLGMGIHWHIQNQVWYYATDPQKQDIPYVRTVDANGRVTEYFDVQAGLPADFGAQRSGQLRLLDCIDCHNRVSHEFRSPTQILDDALSQQQIDASIPQIRQLGVQLLSAQYTGEQQAKQAIEQLEGWYKASYPDYYSGHQAEIRQAIGVIQAGYRTSTFPEMSITAGTHPDNTGHSEFAGCFRCHDGKHVSSKNTTIRLECNLCHSIPQVVAADSPKIPTIALQQPTEPASHLDSNWIARHRFQFDQTCSGCHNVSNPGGSDNSSFCSNSACHGQQWKYVGFDAPKISQMVKPPKAPGSGQARAVPHPIGPRTDCSICHAQGKVHPVPDDQDHTLFSLAACTSCHQPTTSDAPPPAAASGAEPVVAGVPPAIPHDLIGRDNCLLCHNPQGGEKPAPQSHAGRTVDTCQTCHLPQKK